MLLTSMPTKSATLRRISRPVVPASPSMKMAGLVLAVVWALAGAFALTTLSWLSWWSWGYIPGTVNKKSRA